MVSITRRALASMLLAALATPAMAETKAGEKTRSKAKGRAAPVKAGGGAKPEGTVNRSKSNIKGN